MTRQPNRAAVAAVAAEHLGPILYALEVCAVSMEQAGRAGEAPHYPQGGAPRGGTPSIGARSVPPPIHATSRWPPRMASRTTRLNMAVALRTA